MANLKRKFNYIYNKPWPSSDCRWIRIFTDLRAFWMFFIQCFSIAFARNAHDNVSSLVFHAIHEIKLNCRNSFESCISKWFINRSGNHLIFHNYRTYINHLFWNGENERKPDLFCLFVISIELRSPHSFTLDSNPWVNWFTS